MCFHTYQRLFDIRGPLVHELILEFFSTFRFGEVMLDLDTAGALQFQLGGALGEQKEILDSMARDFSRLSTWTVVRLSQMMSQAGVRIKPDSKSSTIVREYVTEPSRLSKSRAELRREIVNMSKEGKEKSNLKTSLTSLKEKKSTMLVENLRSGNLEVLES
ncbi:hypothetical protein Tco_0865980 [Tanacetum coccineum]